MASRAPSLFFLWVQIFHIDDKNRSDQDLDPNTFSSLISTRGPGPKGQEWNMTCVVHVVVVVQRYTVDSGAIEHY